MEVSNCCFAPLYPETDICMKCKDHCTPIDEDEEEADDEND